PAALYLAAAGVGTLGIVDNDVVDLSNLQRQVAHSNDRIGVPKVDSAEIAIHEINPDVNVVKHQVRLDASNLMDILPGYDVVRDQTGPLCARDPEAIADAGRGVFPAYEPFRSAFHCARAASLPAVRPLKIPPVVRWSPGGAGGVPADGSNVGEVLRDLAGK